MAKAPVSGAVKSRLVPPLTADEAAALSRCFIRDTCAAVESAAARVAASSEARVAGKIAYAPAAMRSAFDGLAPTSFQLIAQRGEGLMQRLINVADDLFAAGYESVSMMNSDSPSIPPAILAGAVTSLEQSGDRLAIAGADDGGYCLIGLKRPHWRIFADIAWSTPAVFAQTLERAAELGLEVVRMRSWYDVDEASSLRRLIKELFGAQSPDAPFGARSSSAPSDEQPFSPGSPDGPFNEQPFGARCSSAPSARDGFPAPATRAWLTQALAAGLADRLRISV